MPPYFFDSSSLVKRYVKETGTAWVTNLVDPAAGHSLHLVRLTGVEIVAAMARRVRTGTLSAGLAAMALRQFRAEFKHRYRITGVTAALINRAMALAALHARAYDAVQLAAAMQVQAKYRALGQSLTLVSADGDLNAPANTEGLVVEDPNQHP